MSIFECPCGANAFVHGVCGECGGRAIRMDGMTETELKQEGAGAMGHVNSRTPEQARAIVEEYLNNFESDLSSTSPRELLVDFLLNLTGEDWGDCPVCGDAREED